MTNEYITTIGLEIHAELKTKTKMFCSSPNNAYEAEPNVNVCPVCMAHPGTLPVINRQAVQHVMRVGIALGSKLADYTEFDRKNYFYPDLPKGYQLSQYEYPLVSGGSLNDVQITRVHLEEDTASSIHDEATGATLIDYNRAGVPLMELVTEPVIHSAEQAGAFARELQLLLRYLDVSDANMEMGEMRVEANISVAKAGEELGTKVEIKNLNSFRAMERAVAYEIERHKKLLDSGGTIIQETRGWDEGKQSTFAQRIKEGSADYRYFPDPDLPSLRLSEILELQRETLTNTMPELPWERRARYVSLGIKSDDADLYVRDMRLGVFFDALVSAYPDNNDAIKLASNYVANDLVKIVRDLDIRDVANQSKMPISVEDFKSIIDMLLAKKISSRAGKDVLIACIEEGKEPQKIAEDKNLFQNNSVADLETIVDDILSKNPTVVADFKLGKNSALEFLVGQGMKALRGAADPLVLRDIIKKKTTI